MFFWTWWPCRYLFRKFSCQLFTRKHQIIYYVLDSLIALDLEKNCMFAYNLVVTHAKKAFKTIKLRCTEHMDQVLSRTLWQKIHVKSPPYFTQTTLLSPYKLYIKSILYCIIYCVYYILYYILLFCTVCYEYKALCVTYSGLDHMVGGEGWRYQLYVHL